MGLMSYLTGALPGALVLLGVVFLAGCGPQRNVTVIRERLERPWVDGRGVAAFALDDEKPWVDAAALAQSLDAGARGAFEFSDDAPIAKLEGAEIADGLTHVDDFRIDLAGARMRVDRRPSKVAITPHSPVVLTARHLSLAADPIHMGPGQIHLNFSAENARFERHHFKNDDRPALVMSDASSATVRMSVSRADMEAIMVEAANRVAGPVRVRKVNIHLQALHDGRTVLWELTLDTRVAFLPAILHIKGRADIDASMDATLSDMSCQGDDVLGPLMAKLVWPALGKYEGKTRPLMTFGQGGLRVVDAHVTSGDMFTLEAELSQ